MPARTSINSEAAGAEEQLASFIARYKSEIGALAKAIRAAMRRRFPTALELVYDN